MKRALVLFGLSALLAAPAAAQRDFSDVQMKTTHVAGAVYMLEGSGGNIGVSAGDDGILIVDDQFKPLADKIRAALAGINKGDLKFVLNTHYHGDHVGSNEVFGPEAPIIAHDNVRLRLTTPQVRGDRTVDPLPEAAWPVITFRESVSIHFNGEEIQVIHFPKGHTDGDSIIFFTGAKVVHMGDHMFPGFPFVDLDGGGTVQGYLDNVKGTIDRLPADAKVIPGHGGLTDVAGLKAYHKMLVETVGIVRDRMKAGKSLDEIKAEGLPDHEQHSWRFIDTARWIETIHASYSR